MAYFLAKDITENKTIGTFETYHLAFEAIRKESGYSIGWIGQVFYSKAYNNQYVILETPGMSRDQFLSTNQKANR
jgi:hypothetical protein